MLFIIDEWGNAWLDPTLYLTLFAVMLQYMLSTV